MAVSSLVPPSPSKFQRAYGEFIGRLMFGIEALDTSLQNLNNNDDDKTLSIIGNDNYNKYIRKFTNILLTRLCICSLVIRRQGRLALSSTPSPSPLLPSVVIIEAGNILDFYQFVEFIRIFRVLFLGIEYAIRRRNKRKLDLQKTSNS